MLQLLTWAQSLGSFHQAEFPTGTRDKFCFSYLNDKETPLHFGTLNNSKMTQRNPCIVQGFQLKGDLPEPWQLEVGTDISKKIWLLSMRTLRTPSKSQQRRLFRWFLPSHFWTHNLPLQHISPSHLLSIFQIMCKSHVLSSDKLMVAKGDSSAQITSVNISNLPQHKQCNRLCRSPWKEKNRNRRSIETCAINSVSYTFPDACKTETLKIILKISNFVLKSAGSLCMRVFVFSAVAWGHNGSLNSS